MAEVWTSVIGGGGIFIDVVEVSIEEYAEAVGIVGLLVDRTLENVDSCIVEFIAAGKTDCVAKDEKEKAEEVDIVGTLIDKALEKVDNCVVKCIAVEETDDCLAKEEGNRLKTEDIGRMTIVEFQVEEGTVDNQPTRKWTWDDSSQRDRVL